MVSAVGIQADAKSLLTDKPRYRLHEPVKLTVKLTAKADQDVTFPRPNEQYGFPLSLRSPTSRRSIDTRGWTGEIFPSDEVALKAGQSFQCTRIVETDAAGVFKVQGAIPVSAQAPARGSGKSREEQAPALA